MCNVLIRCVYGVCVCVLNRWRRGFVHFHRWPLLSSFSCRRSLYLSLFISLYSLPIYLSISLYISISLSMSPPPLPFLYLSISLYLSFSLYHTHKHTHTHTHITYTHTHTHTRIHTGGGGTRGATSDADGTDASLEENGMDGRVCI